MLNRVSCLLAVFALTGVDLAGPSAGIPSEFSPVPLARTTSSAGIASDQDQSIPTHAFLWANGTMMDLGTLGGDHSRAVAINDRGQTVGSSTTASGESHAFLWENGEMRDLGTLGGTTSSATAINNRGQVVGVSRTASGEEHPFLWENGEMRDLGTLGGPRGEAKAINERGQVVGESTTASGVRHAFLWENGDLRDLGTLGGELSMAVAINEAGQIIGTSTIDTVAPPGQAQPVQRAFLWQRGEMTDLGTSGGHHSVAYAINTRGQVLVSSATLAGEGRDFIWENGETQDLGGLAVPREANALNDQGQVAGSMRIGARGALRAVLWESGELRELGTVRPTSQAQAYLINDSGQVAGVSLGVVRGRRPERHAALWDGDELRDLGTLGGPFSEPQAINNRGEVVGWSPMEMPAAPRPVPPRARPVSHAVLWENGQIRDLGTLGGLESTARAINDSGQVVGHSMTASGQRHAFLWEDGEMRDLGSPAGPFTTAMAINNRGQILILGGPPEGMRVFFWEEGQVQELGTLGGSRILPWAMNERGQVVGSSTTASGETHAFLWEEGRMQDLGTLGGPRSEAAAINDRGQVVGHSQTPNGATRAVLWQNGRIIDLGTLGGFESRAVSINNAGQVVGFVRLSDERGFVFLWIDGQMERFFASSQPATVAGGAFNDRGQLAGIASAPTGEMVFFVSEDRRLVDLGSLGASPPWGQVHALNDRGQVVGWSRTAIARMEADQEIPIHHAFLAQNGTMIDLGTLGGPNSQAVAINIRGQVVGFSNIAGREQR